VVGILVFEKEGKIIEDFLENIERDSYKKNTKWNKSRHEFRKAYIENLFKADIFQEKIFFEIFGDTKKYIELTSFATAKAILKKTKKFEYKATVFVDGFRKKEIEIFSRGLRDLRIKTRKIRGVKKDENNAFIRLVDAICGLVRDAEADSAWAKASLAKLKKARIVSEI